MDELATSLVRPPAWMNAEEMSVRPLSVRFEVPGIPRGKGRPRAAVIRGHARIYTPKVTAQEEGAVRLFASQAMQGRPLMEGPIDLRLAAYMPVPASWSGRKREMALANRIMPTGRPDLDNVLKLVSDGINGVCIRDDSQVVSFTADKRYDATPRIVVEIRSAA